MSVFHVTQFEASLVAVAFLSSYGLSRLVCGFLADHLLLKPMYLIFAGGQSLALLIAAIGLPLYTNVVFLTVLMCVVGSLFAGGKSLWSMVMMSLFGEPSFPHVMALAMPAFGLAGMVGPITLNAALRSSAPLEATSIWFYAMAGALFVCVGLFASLRHFDFDAMEKSRSRMPHSASSFSGRIDWF